MLEILITPGELLDRYSILQIKHAKITDDAKLEKVLRELADLKEPAEGALNSMDIVQTHFNELRTVNETLWDAEDAIRNCEARQDFGPRFIEVSRSIYKTNDRRFALKNRINMALGCHEGEVKSY